MFARVFKSTVIASVVAFLAVARGGPTSTTTSQCNTGPLQCCNQFINSTTAQEQGLGGLLDLLGLILGDIGDGIGLDCNSINVLGVGSAGDCAQQPVCCTNVMQSGLINLGCSPVNLNL